LVINSIHYNNMHIKCLQLFCLQILSFYNLRPSIWVTSLTLQYNDIYSYSFVYFKRWILHLSRKTKRSDLKGVKVLRYNIREMSVRISSVLLNSLLNLWLLSSVIFMHIRRQWPDGEGSSVHIFISLWLHLLATSPTRHFTSLSLHPLSLYLLASSPSRQFTSLSLYPFSLHVLATSLSRHFTSYFLHPNVTSPPCQFTSWSLHLLVTSSPCHFTSLPLHLPVT
jgi:hypothetical protein